MSVESSITSFESDLTEQYIQYKTHSMLWGKAVVVFVRLATLSRITEWGKLLQFSPVLWGLNLLRYQVIILLGICDWDCVGA